MCHETLSSLSTGEGRLTRCHGMREKYWQPRHELEVDGRFWDCKPALIQQSPAGARESASRRMGGPLKRSLVSSTASNAICVISRCQQKNQYSYKQRSRLRWQNKISLEKKKKEKPHTGLERWLGAKITGCSYRGPRFDSQYPFGISQVSVTTVLGHLTPSHTLEYRQNTNTFEIKLNKIFEKKRKKSHKWCRFWVTWQRLWSNLDK